MGGDYYDRPIYSTSGGHSEEASKVVGKQSTLHKSLNPNRWNEEPLVSEAKNPIVFALDVTGSMGDWSKIIYDKIPMFYGQIKMQNYLEDPSLSFCAVGDYTCDSVPLQVSEFGQGKEIDQLISKIYLEGGGGGGYTESYEFAAYFYSQYTELKNSELPFFFITGDEAFYDTIPKDIIKKIIGSECQSEINSKTVWKDLIKKFNVFLIKKPYHNKDNEKVIFNQWTDALGLDRILNIKTPKACIDVILGAIAITGGKRDLDGYISDMKERGQSDDRVEEVTNALMPYWKSLQNKLIKKVITKTPYSLESLIKDLNKLKLGSFNKEQTEKLNILMKLKETYSEFPKEYLCPLTKEPLIDPVLAEDGQTYEKYAISNWLNSGNTCSPLDSKEEIGDKLISNKTFIKMIDQYIENNK